jgi:hypothetical protein
VVNDGLVPFITPLLLRTEPEVRLGAVECVRCVAGMRAAGGRYGSLNDSPAVPGRGVGSVISADGAVYMGRAMSAREAAVREVCTPR